MKCLIVEDAPLVFEDLRARLLRRNDRIDVVGPVTNLVDLERELCDGESYDVIFMDIQLEDGCCFDVLRRVKVATPIIFTTAYNDFARQALDAGCIAYLEKPYTSDELHEALRKALALNYGMSQLPGLLESMGYGYNPKYKETIVIKDVCAEVVVKVSDIVCVETYGKGKSLVHVRGRSAAFVYDRSVTHCECLLNPSKFFTVSRKAIVNIDDIESVVRNHTDRGGRIVLRNCDVRPDISRSRKEALLKLLR